jgi:hypothetical protein
MINPTETPDQPASKVLCMRTRTDAQDSLTANILFGQLTQYPHMLAESLKLPPFIFPPCVLSPGGQCPQDAPHVCLPKVLAICTSLSQMFFSQTPGSVDFVWRQIQAEVMRLASCVSSMSVLYSG